MKSSDDSIHQHRPFIERQSLCSSQGWNVRLAQDDAGAAPLLYQLLNRCGSIAQVVQDCLTTLRETSAYDLPQ